MTVFKQVSASQTRPGFAGIWIPILVFQGILGASQLLGWTLLGAQLISAVLITVSATFGGLVSGMITAAAAVVVELVVVFAAASAEGQPSGSWLSLFITLPLYAGLAALVGVSRQAGPTGSTAGKAPGAPVRPATDDLDAMKQQLELARIRLRRVTRRLIDMQESDRRRLAKALHDDIGQSLTALRINLESNKSLVERSPAAANFVETSYRLVDEIIASVRELSMELRPSLLDDLGIIAALREYCGKQFARAGITFDFDAYGNDSAISNSTRITVYRIAQEIVANILEHAAASQVTLAITITPEKLSMTFTDDGIGFNVADGESGDDAQEGLTSIRERAAMESGRVAIDSERGAGTTVQVTIPLDGNDGSVQP